MGASKLLRCIIWGAIYKTKIATFQGFVWEKSVTISTLLRRLQPCICLNLGEDGLKTQRLAGVIRSLSTLSRVFTCRLYLISMLSSFWRRQSQENQEIYQFPVMHLFFFFFLQLTSAPKSLPPSLVSADFAANQLTRIYPYTFGHKPKLK